VIGNKDTLQTKPVKDGVLIHQELLKFYNSYYSSEKMTLILMGNYDMEKLEEWAVSKFTDVPVGLDMVAVREKVDAFP